MIGLVIACLAILTSSCLAIPASPATKPLPSIEGDIHPTLPLNGTALGYVNPRIRPSRRMQILTLYSDVPPDPWTIRTGYPLYVTFSDYSNNVDLTRFLTLVGRANEDAAIHNPNDVLPSRSMIYIDGRTYLVIFKERSRSMTWGQWRKATDILDIFLSTWDPISFHFEVEGVFDDHKVVYGFGRLSDTPYAQSATLSP